MSLKNLFGIGPLADAGTPFAQNAVIRVDGTFPVNLGKVEINILIPLILHKSLGLLLPRFFGLGRRRLKLVLIRRLSLVFTSALTNLALVAFAC